MSGAAEPVVKGQLALLRAAGRYDEEGLRLPPVPNELIERIIEHGPWTWGSVELDLMDRNEFLERGLDPETPAYVAFGYVGHGVSSWAMCYQLVQDGLAVFIRQGYGGPYGDDAEQADDILKAIGELEELVVLAQIASEDGELGAGQRLIVVVDTQQDGGWGVTGAAGSWMVSPEPLREALDFLDA